MLSWVYSVMVENLDQEQRHKLDYALRPRDAVVVRDEMMPESMQGLKPPSWWSDKPVQGTVTVDG